MNNEKLISALRSCLALGSRCEDCPLDGDYQECKIDTLYADALDAANYALEAAGRALEAAKDKLHEQDLRIADLVQHLNAEQAKSARLVEEYREIRQSSVSHEVYQAACEERDAAVADMKFAADDDCGIGYCVICVHAEVAPDDKSGPCWDCTNGDCKFLWRGPKAGDYYPGGRK